MIRDLLDALRDDIPGSAILASLLTFWADLLMMSGDLVVDIGLVVVSTVDIWVPLLGNLARLSEVFSWIPEDALETLLLSGIAILTVTYTVRLLRQLQNRLTDS